MINQPIFFESNRVFRVYKGGKLFSDFFGDNSIDGNYPEEWIASTVKALNQNPSSEYEGISKPLEYNLNFNELVSNNANEMLGAKSDLGFLVKLLDSAIRLPAQAHPDKEYSKKYFSSSYGKVESWIILATRPDAKIYFGFRDGVTKEIFKETIENSKSDKSAMQSLMCEIAVKEGDIFFIPAKTIHAIGAGCLILEVQEPTDFTIQPEYWCGDYKLSHDEMYLGLDFNQAMECFDFKPTPPNKKTPKLIKQKNGYIYEELIGKDDTSCFNVNRIKINAGAFTMRTAPAVYVVTNGAGIIIGEEYCRKIKKGDYYFLPYCANKRFYIYSESLEIIECFSS